MSDKLKCPYCGGKDVKPPKVKKWETPCFAHGYCQICGKKPRAKVSWSKDGKMLLSYSKDGRPPMPKYERKSIIVRGRLTPRNMDDLSAGRAKLILDKIRQDVYAVVVSETV